MASPDPFILYVGLPFFVLVWIALNVRLKAIWRDGLPYAKHNFDRGSPAWRAWVRATVALAWLGALGLILGMVAMSLPPNLGVTTVLAAAGGLLFLGSILLGFFIALFNRPKAVIPPLYRDEPGALAEWAVRRRRRRSSSLKRRPR
jgi:hypothetical protein